jgi:hypothetical protein
MSTVISKVWTFSTRYFYPGMRTIILLIYCNIIYSQYGILQYSCVTIQYIAIFFNTNTIYCNIPQRQYNTLQYSLATIQYIVLSWRTNTIYCQEYIAIYCNWFICIGVQVILPGTPICTYRAVLLDVQYIVLGVQYIAIIVWDNTIYCNIRCHQYNISQYSSPTIQYITIFVTRNTIYCIVRTHQYNILLTIYCNIL